jgi:two-component system, NarL family, sensor histidine kinase BarA
MQRRRAIVLIQLVAVAAAAAGFLALQGVSALAQTLCVLVALGVAASLGVFSLYGLDREHRVYGDARRLKIDLLANVSHELRTPLNAILGYAEILDTVADLADVERADMNGRILSNAVTLTCAVNNLLEYSSVVAGEAAIRRGSVVLAELFEEIEPWVGHMLDDKPVTFAWYVDPCLPVIDTDRGKLRQTLMNLLSNAAKFTPRGEIHLSAAGNSTGVEIAVSDTGVGMSADQQTVIFEDFRQIEGSPTRPFGGMGLGLTLVRRFCDLLGGTIVVESAPAKGTRVSLCLPFARPEIGDFPLELARTVAA